MSDKLSNAIETLIQLETELNTQLTSDDINPWVDDDADFTDLVINTELEQLASKLCVLNRLTSECYDKCMFIVNNGKVL